MTILLDSFNFSRSSDAVEESDLILIPGGSFVSTLAGDDTIRSEYTTDTPTISLLNSSGDLTEAVFGIYNQGSLNTGSGKDTIESNIKYTGESSDVVVYGITQAFGGLSNGFTSASIFTGSGDDSISALASSSNSEEIIGIGNFFSSKINTGSGSDEIIGKASGTAENSIRGISQVQSNDPDDVSTGTGNNRIITGNGDDKVIGNGDGQAEFILGISQNQGSNQIITGNGSDEIIGTGSGSGIAATGIFQGKGNNRIITGNGSDDIIGDASSDNASRTIIGILQGTGKNRIITGNGSDEIIGTASGNLNVISEELAGTTVPAMAGISQQREQKIITGNGSDEIIGTADGTATSDNPNIPIPIVGIAKLNSTINTGNSSDKVIGTASGAAVLIAGIAQQGSEDLIITGNGNDEVMGKADGTAGIMAGIAQQPGTEGSKIITGNGNDKVTGEAVNKTQGLLTAGILGKLDILTGSGNDEVIASARLELTDPNQEEPLIIGLDGFAADSKGTVTVNTGSGDDLVKGFGRGNFDGGTGDRDVYDLSEYSFDEFAIKIGAGTNNQVDFTLTDENLGSRTALTQGFEVFRFANDDVRSFSELTQE